MEKYRLYGYLSVSPKKNINIYFQLFFFFFVYFFLTPLHRLHKKNFPNDAHSPSAGGAGGEKKEFDGWEYEIFRARRWWQKRREGWQGPKGVEGGIGMRSRGGALQ